MPADESGSVRTVVCPGCGGSIALRAPGYTVSLACEYCGSLVDVAHPDARIITRYQEAQALLAIPLGTRGTLRGVEWEAIGWLERADGWASWEEYLLFNPYYGYRWLIAQNGHWSLAALLTATPRHDGPDYLVDGRRFSPFYNYNTARVTRLFGEFYWRVKVGEEVQASDYVRPGFMLSEERDERERSWTLSEWLRPAEIVEAFGVNRPIPWLPGMTPLAHQPSPFAARIKGWWPIAAATVLALFVMLMLFGGTGEPQRFGLQVTPDGPAVSQTFGPVVISSRRQAVTLAVRTPNVDQGWVDVDVSLVNRRTQDSYDAYALNEHYSGQDSDGSWSEGERGQTLKVASLPAGTYDLVVDAQAHHWGSTGNWNWDQASGTYKVEGLPPVDVSIKVMRGARFASNFFFALLLVLLPPLLMLALHIMFENARLEQKDGGPADASDWIKGMQSS